MFESVAYLEAPHDLAEPVGIQFVFWAVLERHRGWLARRNMESSERICRKWSEEAEGLLVYGTNLPSERYLKLAVTNGPLLM